MLLDDPDDLVGRDDRRDALGAAADGGAATPPGLGLVQGGENRPEVDESGPLLAHRHLPVGVATPEPEFGVDRDDHVGPRVRGRDREARGRGDDRDAATGLRGHLLDQPDGFPPLEIDHLQHLVGAVEPAPPEVLTDHLHALFERAVVVASHHLNGIDLGRGHDARGRGPLGVVLVGVGDDADALEHPLGELDPVGPHGDDRHGADRVSVGPDSDQPRPLGGQRAGHGDLDRRDVGVAAQVLWVDVAEAARLGQLDDGHLEAERRSGGEVGEHVGADLRAGVDRCVGVSGHF